MIFLDDEFKYFVTLPAKGLVEVSGNFSGYGEVEMVLISDIDDWLKENLSGRCVWAYGAESMGSYQYYVEFAFEDTGDAMKFKLAWG